MDIMLFSLKKPEPRNHSFEDLRDSEYIIIKFPGTDKRWDPAKIITICILPCSLPDVGAGCVPFSYSVHRILGKMSHWEDYGC